ncbi:MAG TPA: ABC transporter ATP-binding protein [Burkholderiaceae bacterium]|jgi:putative ABC transport system ATP-binding protein
MNTPLYEARALGLSYRHRGQEVRALDGLDLAIRAGENMAVLGSSGSGKSTLLGLLGGLQKPTRGQLFFQGRDMALMSAADWAHYRSRQVGFVFQQFCLLPHLRLIDNVLLPVDHERQDRAHWRRKALELLEHMGIADLGQRLPHQVSGGQAQRCAIARALLRDPPILLADEPTGSLDGGSAAQVLDLLLEVSSTSRTLVVVTHSPELAARMAVRVELEAGRQRNAATVA